VPDPNPELEKEPESIGLPAIWYVGVAIVALAGLGLVLWGGIERPTVPVAIQRLSIRVKSDAWVLLLGIMLVGAALTHLLIRPAMEGMGRLFRLHPSTQMRHRLWGPAFLGTVESFLYPGALFVQQPSIIAAWLVLKVAGGWVKGGSRMERDYGERFNRYLLGNAMSLFAAFVVFAFLKVYCLRANQP
jgi:hypothetical protein